MTQIRSRSSNSHWRRWRWLSALLILAAATWWGQSLLPRRAAKPAIEPNREGTAPSPQSPEPLLSPSLSPPVLSAAPPRPPSPFQNTSLDVAYVGSQVCRDCHVEQYDSYEKTAHRHSMTESRADREPPDARFDHAPSSRRFAVDREGPLLRHREWLTDARENPWLLSDHTMQYLLGSGRFTRSYLARQGDFLVESPLTWYASLQSWSMSPGYDRPDHPGFHRVVNYDCLFCHAGLLDLHPGSAERVAIRETAIGCERCHGPGALHVAERKAAAAARPNSAPSEAANGPDRTIVHPGRLSRSLAEAVCHQCHLSSDVRVARRGRRRGEFRPGLPWQEFVVHYAPPAADTTDTGMTVTGHVEQMQLSRCYQQSETLTCLTCHNPHQVLTTPAEKTLHYRKTCLACHGDETCGVALDARQTRNGNDCAACHMPTSATDIPHVAFTHHRIAIHPDPPAAPQPSVSNEPPGRDCQPILPLDGVSDLERQRLLGLAYHELAIDERNANQSGAYFSRVESLLQSMAAGPLADASVQRALAAAASFRGDLATAAARARLALQMPADLAEDHLVAADLLVRIHVQRGEFAEAARHLEQLTEARLYPADWLLLSVCQQRLGQPAQAIRSLERVIAIDPAQPEPYEMLAQWQAGQGNSTAARESLEKARRLRASLAAPRSR